MTVSIWRCWQSKLYTLAKPQQREVLSLEVLRNKFLQFSALSPRIRKKKSRAGIIHLIATKNPETIKATYFCIQCAISCRHWLEVGMLHYQ